MSSPVMGAANDTVFTKRNAADTSFIQQTLADPDADQILYWDDSASAWAWTTAATGDFLKDGSIALTGALDAGNQNIIRVNKMAIGSQAGISTSFGVTEYYLLTIAEELTDLTTELHQNGIAIVLELKPDIGKSNGDTAGITAIVREAETNTGRISEIEGVNGYVVKGGDGPIDLIRPNTSSLFIKGVASDLVTDVEMYSIDVFEAPDSSATIGDLYGFHFRSPYNTFTTVTNNVYGVRISDLGDFNTGNVNFSFYGEGLGDIAHFGGPIRLEGSVEDSNHHVQTAPTLTANRDVTWPDASGEISLANSKTSTHASPSVTSPLAPTWTGDHHIVWYGSTGEIDLPAASAAYTNKRITIYNTGAFTITVDPNASQVIVRGGTVQAGGVSMILASGAGNFITLVCDGSRWVTIGSKGTLSVGT